MNEPNATTSKPGADDAWANSSAASGDATNTGAGARLAAAAKSAASRARGELWSKVGWPLSASLTARCSSLPSS
jgi:hypothetical protein